jgi:prepilin-type processing-associated H-X9-DG protein
VPNEGSYQINGWTFKVGTGGYGTTLLTTAGGGSNASWFYAIALAKNASEAPAFADSTFADGFPKSQDQAPTRQQVNVTGLSPNSPTNGSTINHMQRVALNRHDRAVNVSFLDGHGETVNLIDLWKLKWNTQWGTSLQPPPNPSPVINY